ncbi:MAG: carboxypeptidase regulatory-like domain-containing protein [Bacteroidales bacterium]
MEKSIGEAHEDLWFFDDADAVVRYIPIVPGDAVTGSSTLEKGSRLILNLFPDKELEATIDRATTNANATFVIRARLSPPGAGYLVMSTTEGRSLATIRGENEGKLYRILSDPESGEHYMVELDSDSLDVKQDGPVEYPPPITPGEELEQQRIREQLLQKEAGPDDPADVDVLLVYTPAARDWAATNEGGIRNTLAIAMEYAQLISDNSELGITYRLVNSRLVDYEESTEPGADLRRLTASDQFNPFGPTHEGIAIPGYMNEVHTWRDEYKADLVAMFALVDGVGGLGWQLMDPDGRSNYGFSLTRVQQASWTYTHIHEVGHNMGAHHHKEQIEGPGPGLFNYSAGWRWTGNDGKNYASVMTYESGEHFDDGVRHNRTPYFSNPDVEFQGVATGDPEDGDNARTLRESKQVVSRYRTFDALALEGRIYDENGDPMRDVSVEVKDHGALMFSRGDGSYTFPYLPSGEQTVSVFQQGYYPIEEAVQIQTGQTTRQDFHMEKLVDVAITGFVAPRDAMLTGLDGAIVRFSRDSGHYTTRTEDGYFSMENIPGGFIYDLMVIYPGYAVYSEKIELGTDVTVLDDIYLDRGFPAVDEIRADETDDYIDLDWDTPSFIGNYRHDSGSPTGGLGFRDVENSLMGGAHRRHAWIESVRWVTSNDSNDEVTLRILALTPEGQPDRNNVLYKAEGINNNPGSWTFHELSEVVHAPHGFFVGVGGSGDVLLRTDETDFERGTNFFTSDFERFDLQDMADSDYKRNFFIRAHGYDFGPWLEREEKVNPVIVVQKNADLVDMPRQSTALEDSALKDTLLDEPVGYNIYLDDFDVPYEEGVENTYYRFTGLPHGRYQAGVQAIYEDGVSAITTRQVFSGTPEYILSLEVHPEESGKVSTRGQFAEGSVVTLDAVPYSGYVFSAWIDEESEQLSASPFFEYEMPARDVTLTAVFEEDPQGAEALKVFPNPATTHINVVTEQTIEEVRLVNMMGQLVHRATGINDGLYQIRLAGLTEGLYVLQVRTSGGWEHARVQLLNPSRR